MTAVSKNVYIDKLNEIVYKYNKTCATMKMKYADFQVSTNSEYGVEHNCKDSTFKVGDYVRISKYENILAKGYIPNWS